MEHLAGAATPDIGELKMLAEQLERAQEETKQALASCCVKLEKNFEINMKTVG